MSKNSVKKTESIPQNLKLLVHVRLGQCINRHIISNKHIIYANRITFSVHFSLLLWQKEVYISSIELFSDFHGRFQKRRNHLKFKPTTIMSTADLKPACRKIINV